jgi:hypothetical protein
MYRNGFVAKMLLELSPCRGVISTFAEFGATGLPAEGYTQWGAEKSNNL